MAPAPLGSPDRPPRGGYGAARAAAVAALLVAATGLAALVVRGAPGGTRAGRTAGLRASRVRRSERGARARTRRHADEAQFHGPLLRGAAARRATVPILMYHVIARAPAATPFPQLWVPPRAFRAQLAALAAAGYTGVTLGQVFAAWDHGAPLPRRPVVLSFDDGYASDATRAAPVLRRLRWPAVLNLAIRNVGRGGIRLRALRRLVADGWEIDSHTVHHPDLTTLPGARVRAELVDSRAWIRHTLGAPARFFCYPAGRFDAALVAAVRAAGYRGATTELPGRAAPGDDRFELPRLRVSAGTAVTALVGAP